MGPLTAAAVEAMDYNQLIGVVRETNRPPGGLRSIALIARNAFLTSRSHVLEIGTSTGITAVELARLAGCRITAIDINEDSLAEARRRAERAGVGHLVACELRDATSTGFDDGEFDAVFCGNVTSLIEDREQALAEYARVLKDGGFVGAIPMYYVEPPSDALIADVSAAIQVNITPLDKRFWQEFFTGDELQPYWRADYRFDRIDDAVVDAFVDDILARPHIGELAPDVRAALEHRYREHMHLFKVNLSHMGFTVLLLRKEPAGTEPELFTSTAVGP